MDQTNDFYELIVERHRQHSTIITSNREPDEILTMMADQMLARGLQAEPTNGNAATSEPLHLPATSGDDPGGATVVPAAGRFARDAAEFATGRAAGADEQMRRPS